MVDHTLILRKIANLDEYHHQLGEYAHISLDEYINDWKLQRIIERTLQMMIETCSDIAGHIISDLKYRVPTSYSDTFKVLQENDIIQSSLSNSMMQMVKFRNVVVHDYDRVDGEIVIGILRKRLDDFITYKDAIVKFLKEKNSC